MDKRTRGKERHSHKGIKERGRWRVADLVRRLINPEPETTQPDPQSSSPSARRRKVVEPVTIVDSRITILDIP